MNVTKRIEEEMERFPEGSVNHNFFKQLHKNLKPEFLRKSVRKELIESRANLSGSIQQYFKQHIIYTSALKAVDCSQLEQNESSLDNVELFYLNILKKYVHNDKSGEKLKFFEGSQELLTKMLQNKQKVCSNFLLTLAWVKWNPSAKPNLTENSVERDEDDAFLIRKSKSAKMFSKLVEDNINEFCMQFSEYALQKKVNLRTWEKDFDSAIKQLSLRAAILDSADVKFNVIAPELQTVLSSYYEELTEGIEVLDKLLDLFAKKIEFQMKMTTLAIDRSVHLKLKSECLELELMVSTYSKSAIDALKIIKTELDEKIKVSEEGVDKLNNQLEYFQILGPEYEQLVERYQLLLEKVEKQKWAIKFLKDDIASKQKAN